MTRAILAGLLAALVALLALTAPACGPGSADADGDPWPLELSSPGVVGYVVLPGSADDLSAGLGGLLGWAPGGLRPRGALGVAWLDVRTHGGEYALLLPVDDEAAFRASLDAAPSVTELATDRYVFELPPDHPLVEMLQMASALAGGVGAGASPTDLLGALRQRPTLRWEMELRVDDGQAVLAPTYDSAIVVGRLLDEVPGLREPAPDDALISADVTALRLAYRDQIEAATQQMRALLLGTQMAGFGSLLANMASDGRPMEMTGLGVSGPFTWALLEMLAPDALVGVQVAARGADAGPLVRAATAALEGGELDRSDVDDPPSLWAGEPVVGLRLRWDDEAPLGALAESLRPAPSVPGAAALGFDPATFAPALAAWCRPLVELALGEGEPAVRTEAQLAELVEPLGGAVVVGAGVGAQAVAATLQPGRTVDVASLVELLELLLAEANVDEPFAALQLRDGPPGLDEDVPAGSCWQADDLLVLVLADGHGDALDRFTLAVRDARIESGSALSLPEREELDGGWLDLRAAGRELSLELGLPAEGR